MIFSFIFSILIVVLGIVVYKRTDREIDTGSFILGAVLSAICSALYLSGGIIS